MRERAYLREWQEALARERQAREHAFCDPQREICGEPIRPMRLRDFSLLLAIRSPFLCGGELSREHAVQFLSILSPSFDVRFHGEQSGLLRRVIAAESEDPGSIVCAIRLYVEALMVDAPGGGGDAPISSMEAAVIHRLASAYHWPREAILDLPLVEIFHYLRLIAADSGVGVADTGSISAGPHAAYLAAINEVPPEERAAWRARQEELAGGDE